MGCLAPDMVSIPLKYVVGDVDRHGNVRYYVRRKGTAKVRLPGDPGSAEFMDAYHAALGMGSSATKPRASAPAPGSFRAVCVAYFASPQFRSGDDSTKAWQRRALENVAREHGDKPISMMKGRHVRKLRDERSETPAAANALLKSLRGLFAWAVEAQLADDNPALGVKPLKYLAKGHHSWTPEEVAQFEGRHPLGSKARLAMALLLYTAGRREDAVRLGPRNIINGRMRYTQAKNEHRSPVSMDIPIHDDLAAVLAASPIGAETFLVTDYGKPFTAPGFGNKFREWCTDAGLPHCSAHGLRKATAARLAERGASPHEIMAITGHRTLGEVERYTKAARQPGLADSAMERLRN